MVDETQRSSSSIDRKSLENKTKPDNLVLNKISKEFKTKEKKTKTHKSFYSVWCWRKRSHKDDAMMLSKLVGTNNHDGMQNGRPQRPRNSEIGVWPLWKQPVHPSSLKPVKNRRHHRVRRRFLRYFQQLSSWVEKNEKSSWQKENGVIKYQSYFLSTRTAKNLDN